MKMDDPEYWALDHVLTKEEYFQNRQQKDNEPIKDNNIYGLIVLKTE